MKRRGALSGHGPKLSVEYPRVILRVMNRSQQREPIFPDDTDRQRLVQTLGEVGAKTACLCVPHADRAGSTLRLISDCRSQIHPGGKGASRFNRRHKLFGHHSSGRCKPLVAAGSGSGYLTTRFKGQSAHRR